MKTLPILLLWLFFLVRSIPVFGCSPDSLRQAIAEAKDFEARLAPLLDLTAYYCMRGHDSTLVLADDAMTLAEKTGWNRRNNAPTTLTADTAEETALIAEFVQLDTNQDGMLSRQEMGNHDGVIKSWTDLDANQDDYLDQDEFNGMVNDPSLTEQTGWDRRSTPPDGASS